jgi:hypothetical protein
LSSASLNGRLREEHARQGVGEVVHAARPKLSPGRGG